MRHLIYVFILLTVFSICLVAGGYAATVDGHAYKDGQTDHSGITIDLEPLPPVPTLGGIGLFLLLTGISLCLLRKKGRRVMVPMVICLVAGISCMAYAGYLATTVTNSDGEYDFANVEPGAYSIDASAPGYYPEHISSFTVIDGTNTAPDITLYPMETPTPVPTDTPMPTDTPVPTETPTSTPTLATVIINEIRIDQPSADNDEYFELYGDADAGLVRLTYLVIGEGTGGSGVIEAVVDLDSQVIPGDGYFVAAEDTFTLGTPDFETSLNFENSDNVTHLLVADFTGSNGDDLDTDDDGVLDVTPWSTVVDAIGLVEADPGDEHFYGAALGFTDIGPDGTFVPGHVSRCPDGGAWLIGVYDLGIDDSPGNANICTTPTPLPVAGDLISVDPIIGNMRYVPAGTFTQGSPDGSGVDPAEPCRAVDETQFNHTLTRDLAVMETEITRQMWADLLAAQPSLPADPTNTGYGSGMTNPVQNNSWYEAVLFANLLSIQNGYTPCYYRDSSFLDIVDSGDYINDDHYCDFDADGYRLATEGEWEYFTRAGTTTAFSCNEPAYTSGTCGSTSCVSGEFPVLEQYAVYCANDPGTTALVGSKDFNPWNLKDLHGNVLEWCWDLYGTYPAGSEIDYEGAVSGSNRVFRGGFWTSYAQYCRSADRSNSIPGDRNIYLGARFLRSID